MPFVFHDIFTVMVDPPYFMPSMKKLEWKRQHNQIGSSVFSLKTQLFCRHPP